MRYTIRMHPRELKSTRAQMCVLVLILGLVTLLAFALSRTEAQIAPLASSETNFVEHTAQSLNIVPASCPSDPHYAGGCTPVCVPSNVCSGNNIMHTDASCGTSITGACTYPQSPGCADDIVALMRRRGHRVVTLRTATSIASISVSSSPFKTVRGSRQHASFSMRAITGGSP